MTGPELIMWMMIISALVTVINGGVALFNVGSNKKQVSGAERIFLKRVFEGTEPTQVALNDYFNKLNLCLNEATWSFCLAFVIFLFLFEGIASKVILAFLFVGPLAVLLVVRREMSKTRTDFINRLNDE